MRYSMLSASGTLLRFGGVTHCDLPDDLAGNWWLYEELDISQEGAAGEGTEKAGFRIRALPSSARGYLAMNELSVAAETVEVVLAGPDGDDSV